MILAAEIECFIYDAQLLKEKRSVFKTCYDENS